MLQTTVCTTSTVKADSIEKKLREVGRHFVVPPQMFEIRTQELSKAKS